MHRSRANRLPAEGTGGPTNVIPPVVDQGPAWAAPEAVPETHASIPYRGNEMHGVAHTVDEQDYRAYQQKDEKMVQGVPVLGRDNTENDETPIPVRVVDTTAPLTTRRKFSTSQLPIAIPVAGEANRTLTAVGARQNRNKVRITNKPLVGAAAGRVYYGPEDSINPQNSAFLDTGESIDLETNEAVYVMIEPTSANGSLLLIVQHYQTSIVDVEKNVDKKR